MRLGRCKVTVWLNYSRDGRPFYAANPGRIYRTEEGYATATNLDRSDLLVMAECLRLAALWMYDNPLSTNGDEEIPF